MCLYIPIEAAPIPHHANLLSPATAILYPLSVPPLTALHCTTIPSLHATITSSPACLCTAFLPASCLFSLCAVVDARCRYYRTPTRRTCHTYTCYTHDDYCCSCHVLVFWLVGGPGHAVFYMTRVHAPTCHHTHTHAHTTCCHHPTHAPNYHHLLTPSSCLWSRFLLRTARTPAHTTTTHYCHTPATTPCTSSSSPN